jgi:hypothetical protein
MADAQSCLGMTPPRFLVNASLRLDERELQWNPISLDSSYRRHGYTWRYSTDLIVELAAATMADPYSPLFGG